eukprot:8307965-Pyramimonas_sp.AAC.1
MTPLVILFEQASQPPARNVLATANSLSNAMTQYHADPLLGRRVMLVMTTSAPTRVMITVLVV